MKGPDFSSVDSLAKAVALFEQGKLEKLWLMPEAFGGSDIPHNTVYVPLGIAAIKSDTDLNVIAPLAAEGKVTHYAAVPKYSGASVIPIAIQVTSSDPSHFVFDLNIWGEALT